MPKKNCWSCSMVCVGLWRMIQIQAMSSAFSWQSLLQLCVFCLLDWSNSASTSYSMIKLQWVLRWQVTPPRWQFPCGVMSNTPPLPQSPWRTLVIHVCSAEFCRDRWRSFQEIMVELKKSFCVSRPFVYWISTFDIRWSGVLFVAKYWLMAGKAKSAFMKFI